MQIISSFFIAIGLAMDAFAVSMGIGTTTHAASKAARFRLAFHFGFFQMIMTILGWFAGSTIATLIHRFDHWVAFALLLYVGGNMIRSGLSQETTGYPEDPSRGRLMLVLCIAVSIDALAVGLSMAMIEAPVLFPSIVIGLVTFALSLVGLLAGDRLGRHFGKRMEILGGLVLIGIGLQILFSHLF